MAINRATLDAATHVPFMRRTTDGGLVDLGFDLVTIDGQSFWQPVAPGRRVSGMGQTGKIAPPIILDQNLELPIPVRPSEVHGRGQYGVFFYGGRW